MTPFIVGVAGGSGSGKSTFCRMIHESSPDDVVIVEHDYYYYCLAHQPLDIRASYNFDHPDSLETSLLIEHLQTLKSGIPIEAPQYRYATNSRLPETKRIDPHPVILVDGILVLCDARLRSMFDLKVFVDVSDKLRYERRLERDCKHREQTPEQVLAQYLATVKPMHDEFVAPSRESADLIIDGASDFSLAIETFFERVRENTTSKERLSAFAGESARS